ncbi:hypothetical protein [Nostoc sp.]|uniref:hypothetical protein n=1 Tax=Nostoc sp. TaxID=1180 RepID=UPI002FFB568F
MLLSLLVATAGKRDCRLVLELRSPPAGGYAIAKSAITSTLSQPGEDSRNS